MVAFTSIHIQYSHSSVSTVCNLCVCETVVKLVKKYELNGNGMFLEHLCSRNVYT
jgi:hypothetical protein